MAPPHPFGRARGGSSQDQTGNTTRGENQQTFQYGKRRSRWKPAKSRARPAARCWSRSTAPRCWSARSRPESAREARTSSAHRRLLGRSSTPAAIPGGFFKREGRRPKETLTSRLIDRPIRPLFPGLQNEVQIIATLISLNPEVEGDIPALLGASAALALCRHPVPGPDRRREGRLQERRIPAQPDVSELKESSSSWSSPAPANAVLMMVESGPPLLSGT